MKFNNPYWSRETKIEMLEQWVLVHSFIYYEMDMPIVSDYQFDHNAHQLAKALAKYPEAAQRSRYAYCFEGFDGSTGHHLYNKLTKEDKGRISGTGLFLLNITK